jgi:hypothetical protein
MKIYKENKDSRELLKQLLEDLDNDDVIYLRRFPEPVGEFRYRDLLKKMYFEIGSCLAVVWLFFEDGRIKIYSFLIEANLEEGEVKNITAINGFVQGKLIEEKGSMKEIVIFEKSYFNKGEEILHYLEEVGNKYRDREIKATLKNALKEEIG